MNLSQFIDTWTGKYCEVTGSANALNQCVDLANAYIRDVIGKDIIKWTDAKDFPSKVSQDDYDWIPNKGLIVPSVGDIVVWSSNHIAICAFSDIELPWFTSFDQNWPTGSVCHKVDHNYQNVSGWLHPKGEASMTNMYKGLDLTNLESMKACVDLRQDVMDGKYITKEESDKITARLESEKRDLQKKIDEHKCPIIPDAEPIAKKYNGSKVFVRNSEGKIIEEISYISA